MWIFAKNIQYGLSWFMNLLNLKWMRLNVRLDYKLQTLEDKDTKQVCMLAFISFHRICMYPDSLMSQFLSDCNNNVVCLVYEHDTQCKLNFTQMGCKYTIYINLSVDLLYFDASRDGCSFEAPCVTFFITSITCKNFE